MEWQLLKSESDSELVGLLQGMQTPNLDAVMMTIFEIFLIVCSGSSANTKALAPYGSHLLTSCAGAGGGGGGGSTSTPEDRLRAVLSVNRTDYCPLKQLISNEKSEQRRNGKARREWKITLSSVFLVNSGSDLKKQNKKEKKKPQKAPTQQICSTTTIQQFSWCSQSTGTELYAISMSALKWAPYRILL